MNSSLPTVDGSATAEQIEHFHQLQSRLRDVWQHIEERLPFDHTSVVVPSLSFDTKELAKIDGVPFYEERLLFSLIRLRDPRARLVYLTSQPVDPNIVDYYLQYLIGVPARHARSRLQMLCTYDASARPLTQKILERPRLIERIRRFVGDPEHAYLTCFNSTPLERALAVELDMPLNGVDPELLELGTKSGCRALFREAGVDLPPGAEDLRNEGEVVDALLALSRLPNPPRRAVLKLNESFAGAGNATYTFPGGLPEDDGPRRRALALCLHDLEWSADGETWDSFVAKFSRMGGIAEAFVEASEVHSPSAQMRVHPDGSVDLISTHDQVLGGATGQSYQGCRFPADREYRALIQEEAMKVGRLLRDRGVISRFAVDFVVLREPGEPWRAAAIEINLRMGGTTPPFLALQFLTGGELDQRSGDFQSNGRIKYYYATDNLRSSTYRGLLPEDFIDILTVHRLHFRPATETGVLFHMIGALSEFGKVGVTCIGDSREEADELFERTVAILDRETGASLAGTRGQAMVDLDRRDIGRME